jgi:hypothetical protein
MLGGRPQCRRRHMKRSGFVPLSYWLHLWVEGSVVGLFELDWRDVAERAVELVVVVPVDPSGGGVFDVSEALVWPGAEMSVSIHSAL